MNLRHLGENVTLVLLFSYRGLDSSVWFVVAGSRLMDLEVGRFEDGRRCICTNFDVSSNLEYHQSQV